MITGEELISGMGPERDRGPAGSSPVGAAGSNYIEREGASALA
jgi:hypothetical protein